MAARQLFYIKERFNPQFNKPYYAACGRLSKKAAKAKEDTLYGTNIMHGYTDLESYNKEIQRLKDSGHKIL